MKLSENTSDNGYLIQGYSAGFFVINDHDYGGSLIVSPQHLVTDWRPRAVEELTATDLDPVIALSPQIIVLGTGATQIFPPWAIFAEPLRQGIGLEIMDTGAACRTYNILMSEGRRVAAALILI